MSDNHFSLWLIQKINKEIRRNPRWIADDVSDDAWLWLVKLNIGLRPTLNRLVSVFGLSERLLQRVKWPNVRCDAVQWHSRDTSDDVDCVSKIFRRQKNRCSGKTNLGIHFRERYFHYESNSFKLCAQHDDRNFIDRMLFKQAYSMCVTVASTIFYSLNCCIRIIFYLMLCCFIFLHDLFTAAFCHLYFIQ